MFSTRLQVHRLPAQVTVFLHISETLLRARHNYSIFFFVLLRVASLLVVLLRSSSYFFGLFALLLSFSFVFAFLCSLAHSVSRSLSHPLTRSPGHSVSRPLVQSSTRSLGQSSTRSVVSHAKTGLCLIEFDCVLKLFSIWDVFLFNFNKNARFLLVTRAGHRCTFQFLLLSRLFGDIPSSLTLTLELLYRM